MICLELFDSFCCVWLRQVWGSYGCWGQWLVLGNLIKQLPLWLIASSAFSVMKNEPGLWSSNHFSSEEMTTSAQVHKRLQKHDRHLFEALPLKLLWQWCPLWWQQELFCFAFLEVECWVFVEYIRREWSASHWRQVGVGEGQEHSS